MSGYNYINSSAAAEKFQSQQEAYADMFRPVLTPGLKPGKSDEDLNWIFNETGLNDVVEAIGGSAAAAEHCARMIHSGVEWHRDVYGFDPSDGQLAGMGATLKYYLENFNKSPMIKETAEIMESLSEVSTRSDAFSVIPQFMTMAVLIHLTMISYNFCHSVGSVGADKITVYELDEQVGPNPYGVEEGSSINGLYDGKLADVRRLYDMTRTTDGPPVTQTTYVLTSAYPITKGAVTLIVNKRKVAVDDGNGNFNIINGGKYNSQGDAIAMASSSITYCDGSEDSSVQIVMTGEFPDTIPVWARVDTDVENYSAYVSQTQYRTKEFSLTSEPSILTTGVTLQGILKGSRNMKTNIKDTAFARLSAILNADGDRKVLRDLFRYAEGEQPFSLDVADYRHKYEQWAHIREPMNRASENMKRRTDGKAGILAWIGGNEFKQMFLNMGPPWVELAPTARNPALANQPHYFGKFEGYMLFYNPSYATNTSAKTELAVGVGRGDNISACATVLGTVTPPLLKRHPVGRDLAYRATIYNEKVADQPPEAFKFVTYLLLTDLPI